MQRRSCFPIMARGLFAASLLTAAAGCGSEPPSDEPLDPGNGVHNDGGRPGVDAGAPGGGNALDAGEADGGLPSDRDGGNPSEDPDAGDDPPLGPVDWPSAECKAKAEQLVAQMTARFLRVFDEISVIGVLAILWAVLVRPC